MPQSKDGALKQAVAAEDSMQSALSAAQGLEPVQYDPQYILMVNHLKKYFPIKGGLLSQTVGHVKAVDGVTFNLKRGTTMGIRQVPRVILLLHGLCAANRFTHPLVNAEDSRL